MALDLHTVSVMKGSTPLAFTDRLLMGLLASTAIPGPVGELTGATVLNPGSGYTSIPTAVAASGSGATLAVTMALLTSLLAAAGSGYAPGDTVTLTGGTASPQAIIEVQTTKLVSAAVNAPGTGYAPGDTIVPVGGTFTGSPLLTVTDTKAVSATVVNGGTGGTPGAVTLTGTTGTGTKFQATGTINGSGVLTGALVISVAGDYTVNPTSITNEPVTNNASATGIVVSVVMGAKTVTASGGAYTANASSLTQGSTSGVGTGATFNTLAYGVNTYQLQNAGSYSVLPSSPVSQGSTSGSGTGFQLTASTWQVQSVSASGGINYPNGTPITFSGGGGSGATGQAVTNPIGEPVELSVSSINSLPPAYSVFPSLNGPANVSINGKSSAGFKVLLRPLSSSEPVLASSVDLLLLA